MKLKDLKIKTFQIKKGLIQNKVLDVVHLLTANQTGWITTFPFLFFSLNIRQHNSIPFTFCLLKKFEIQLKGQYSLTRRKSTETNYLGMKNPHEVDPTVLTHLSADTNPRAHHLNLTVNKSCLLSWESLLKKSMKCKITCLASAQQRHAHLSLGVITIKCPSSLLVRNGFSCGMCESCMHGRCPFLPRHSTLGCQNWIFINKNMLLM